MSALFLQPFAHHVEQQRANSRQRSWKKVESVAKISFQTRGLTCVSQMEQDGARREAEAGDVGTELDPLQRREGNKTQCDFLSSAKGQKSQKKLFTT